MSEINFSFSFCAYIFISCFIGLSFAIYNWLTVINIDTFGLKTKESLTQPFIEDKCISLMNKIAKKIQKGSVTFLTLEFIYAGFYSFLFALIILLLDNLNLYTTFAFILGVFTSIFIAFVGMYIATNSNVRVAYIAYFYGKSFEDEIKYMKSFNVAFRGGLVLGFSLVSICLLTLTTLIMSYICKHILITDIIQPHDKKTFTDTFQYIVGYSLGISSVALFCRVGGGIYTKSADVGADLVGKVIINLNKIRLNLKEDSPDNPATIADNVGDNVGDITGMGSDLLCSLVGTLISGLIISSSSDDLIKDELFYFPLIITASAIFVCIFSSFFATQVMKVTNGDNIETALKSQLLISSILLTPIIYYLSIKILPQNVIFDFMETPIESFNYRAIVCILSGLWSGLLIAYITDYYTSNKKQYFNIKSRSTQKLADSCKTGASITIIHGLALGYISCFFPTIIIAISIFISYSLCGLYGISLTALGILSNMTISLSIDAFGPISDNAGGIATMSDLPSHVRETTDSLDAAGNTTAAIGKGYAISSACFVALTIFGAFVVKTKIYYVNILEPIQFSCLIVGAMIPYCFSALAMKSVGDSAEKLSQEIIRQHDENRYAPEVCIKIATKNSLNEMILPGVILTPIVLGFSFGPKAVTGYLSGVIVSGMQLAISSSNSGGALDNAKKYVEGNKVNKFNDEEVMKEGYEAAVVGDTVGDPLKDTTGPSLNIIIKLSAIISLMFGHLFVEFSVLKF